jgi:hypothetical protein
MHCVSGWHERTRGRGERGGTEESVHDNYIELRVCVGQRRSW